MTDFGAIYNMLQQNISQNMEPARRGNMSASQSSVVVDAGAIRRELRAHAQVETIDDLEIDGAI